MQTHRSPIVLTQLMWRGGYVVSFVCPASIAKVLHASPLMHNIVPGARVPGSTLGGRQHVRDLSLSLSPQLTNYLHGSSYQVDTRPLTHSTTLPCKRMERSKDEEREKEKKKEMKLKEKDEKRRKKEEAKLIDELLLEEKEKRQREATAYEFQKATEKEEAEDAEMYAEIETLLALQAQTAAASSSSSSLHLLRPSTPPTPPLVAQPVTPIVHEK